MRRRKDLQGLAVVDVSGGRKLGTVDDLVVSPQDGSLVALTLSRGLMGGTRRYVAMDDVKAIGADAVTVVSEDAARPESEMSDDLVAAREASRNLVGKKVVTENGSLLGTIGDYYVDETERRVTGLTVGGGGILSGEDAVAADRIVSLGPDAVIVTEEDQADGRPSGWSGR